MNPVEEMRAAMENLPVNVTTPVILLDANETQIGLMLPGKVYARPCLTEAIIACAKKPERYSAIMGEDGKMQLDPTLEGCAVVTVTDMELRGMIVYHMQMCKHSGDTVYQVVFSDREVDEPGEEQACTAAI